MNFILKKDFEGADTRVRFGSLDGDAEELQFSQLFGRSWSGGNALIGYQYSNRDALPSTAVPYFATAGDQRRFGGTDWRLPRSNPGVILNAGSRPAYAIPPGQNGTGLTLSALAPLNGQLPADYPLDWFDDRDSLPEEQVHTVFFHVSHALNEYVAQILPQPCSTACGPAPLPWCPPCRRDNPKLIALKRELGQHPFEIISVSVAEREMVTQYMTTASSGCFFWALWPHSSSGIPPRPYEESKVYVLTRGLRLH